MNIEESVTQAIEALFTENRREGKPLYVRRHLPDDLDVMVGDFVKMFMQAAPAERARISAAVPPRAKGLFTCFATRMATLGVREHSRQRLLEGLVALVIEGYKDDFRDTIIRLAPLYDAAVKNGLDAQELFNEAADYLDNATATDTREFPQREPEKRTLKSMGFRESFDADGFKYEKTF